MIKEIKWDSECSHMWVRDNRHKMLDNIQPSNADIYRFRRLDPRRTDKSHSASGRNLVIHRTLVRWRHHRKGQKKYQTRQRVKLNGTPPCRHALFLTQRRRVVYTSVQRGEGSRSKTFPLRKMKLDIECLREENAPSLTKNNHMSCRNDSLTRIQKGIFQRSWPKGVCTKHN